MMNISVAVYTAITLLLACGEVLPFAPSSSSAWRVGRSRTVVAATSEDSGEGGRGVAVEEDGEDEYDFEAGFRDRLAKEGGVAGLQMKAAKRSVDSASRAAQRQVTTSARKAASSAKEGTKDLFADIGLLSKTDWGMTLLSLGAVVIIVVATQFAAPPPKTFADLSTREQLEKLNSQREPEVTFGRAGFKI